MKRIPAILIALLTAALVVSSARAEGDKTGDKVVRKHWFVSGAVQGVGFRAFTYEAAIDLNLKGWVRNLTDLRVEIVVEGPEAAVGKLLDKVKAGPRTGRVDAVADAKVDEAEKLAEKFEIHDTARASEK